MFHCIYDEFTTRRDSYAVKSKLSLTQCPRNMQLHFERCMSCSPGEHETLLCDSGTAGPTTVLILERSASGPSTCCEFFEPFQSLLTKHSLSCVVKCSSKLKIGGGLWPSYLGVPAFHSADKSVLSVDRCKSHFKFLLQHSSDGNTLCSVFRPQRQ